MSKQEILCQLEEKYKSSFKKEGEISFRSGNYILTGIIEEELANSKKLNETEKACLLEELLRERCQYRGFENQEEIDNYIKAVSNGDFAERRRILLKKADKLEKAERFVWAAEEYFEAGETEKAAEILIKAGHQGFTNGEEFLMAADCLVKAGVKKEEAYSKMSEEVRKMIAMKKEKYGWWSSIDRAYYYLGECLHNAGEKEDALEAFMETGSDEVSKLEVGRNYLVQIEEWEKAAEFQKKLINERDFNLRDDYLKLAEYYNKAGLKKGEAEALWKARNYLEAARIAFEITKNKEVFLKAAEAYRSIRQERQGHFFRNVWHWFDKNCWDIYYDGSIEKNREEKLNKVHDLFVFLYSAYSLPLPPKISDDLGNNITKHRETANNLYKEFQGKRKSAKKSQLKDILSDFTFINAVEHAALGGLDVYKIKDIVKEAFTGMPHQRPLESKLTPEAQKLWQEAEEWEISIIDYDPVEMAGRTYEEGGYYKEARERYLKANLLDDAKRMKELI